MKTNFLKRAERERDRERQRETETERKRKRERERERERERKRERDQRSRRNEIHNIVFSVFCQVYVIYLGQSWLAADTGTSPTSGGSEGHEGSPGMAEQTHKQYFSVMKRG